MAGGGGPAAVFFLARTDREVSAERPDAWRLYRLHDLAAAPCSSSSRRSKRW